MLGKTIDTSKLDSLYGVPIKKDNFTPIEKLFVDKCVPTGHEGTVGTYCNKFKTELAPVSRAHWGCHAPLLRQKGNLEEVVTQFSFHKECGPEFLEFMMSDNGPHRLLFEASPKENWGLIWDTKTNNIGAISVPKEVAQKQYVLLLSFLIMTRNLNEFHPSIKAWKILVDNGMDPAYAYYACVNLQYVSENEMTVRACNWTGAHQILNEVRHYLTDKPLNCVDVRGFRDGNINPDPKYENSGAIWEMSGNIKDNHKISKFMFKSYAKTTGGDTFGSAISVIEVKSLDKFITAFTTFIDKRYDNDK